MILETGSDVTAGGDPHISTRAAAAARASEGDARCNGHARAAAQRAAEGEGAATSTTTTADGLGYQARGKVAEGGDRATGVGNGDVATGAATCASASNVDACIHRRGAGGAGELCVERASTKAAAAANGLGEQAVGVIAVDDAIEQRARGDRAAAGDGDAASIRSRSPIATHHGTGIDRGGATRAAQREAVGLTARAAATPQALGVDRSTEIAEGCDRSPGVGDGDIAAGTAAAALAAKVDPHIGGHATGECQRT